MNAAMGPPAPGKIPRKDPIAEPIIIGKRINLRSEILGNTLFMAEGFLFCVLT